MKPYATKDDFFGIYPDTELSENQIRCALAAASVDVDSLTFNRITACGFDNLTDFQKEVVRTAVCRQAHFRVQNEELFGGSIASYSLNGASVTLDKSRLIAQGGAVTESDVFSVLSQSGLCCRRLT